MKTNKNTSNLNIDSPIQNTETDNNASNLNIDSPMQNMESKETTFEQHRKIKFSDLNKRFLVLNIKINSKYSRYNPCAVREVIIKELSNNKTHVKFYDPLENNHSWNAVDDFIIIDTLDDSKNNETDNNASNVNIDNLEFYDGFEDWIEKNTNNNHGDTTLIGVTPKSLNKLINEYNFLLDYAINCTKK